MRKNPFIGKWLIMDTSAIKKEFGETLAKELLSVHSFYEIVTALGTETDATLAEFNSRKQTLQPATATKNAKKARKAWGRCGRPLRRECPRAHTTNACRTTSHTVQSSF